MDYNVDGKYEEQTMLDLEMAYREMINNNSQDEVTEIIADISKLLELNKENYRKVREQKWFKRAVNTLSGKNRRLKKINEENLLDIQKSAIYFLDNMAHENVALMKTVMYSINRIDYQELQDERIKSFILEWTQKNNLRNKELEGRIFEIESRINKSTNNSIFNKLSKWFIINKESEKNRYKETSNKIYDESYEKTINEVMDNLKLLFEKYNHEFTLDIIQFFIVKRMYVKEKYEPKLSLNLSVLEQCSLVNELLRSIEFNHKILESNIVKSVNDISDYYNQVFSGIFSNYFENSPHRYISVVDYKTKNNLQNTILSIINSMNTKLNDLNKNRMELLRSYPEYERCIRKSKLYKMDFTKEKKLLAEDLLFPPKFYTKLGILVIDEMFDVNIKEDVAKLIGIRTKNMKIRDFNQQFNKYLSDIVELYEFVLSNVFEKVNDEIERFSNDIITCNRNVFEAASDSYDEFVILNMHLSRLLEEYK